MANERAEIYPLIPIPYGNVLFPGKTLHISPSNREDVVAIIAKYYTGALKTGPKSNAPLIGCVPLRSPLLSADGKKLIEDADKSSKQILEPDVTHATKDDLFQYGCIARISGIRGGRQGDVALVVDGLSRCKITKITSESPYLEGKLVEYKDAGE